MIRRCLLLVPVAAGLAGCGLFTRHPPPPPTPAHYTLGNPYQMGGVWYYPKDLTEYDATGLAAVDPPHAGLVADGERYDATAMAASHHTLQLPSIVRVTNMENGREALLRLNDRGPANPGRLLGLTPRAAALLGAADGTKLRVRIESGMTRTLGDQVGGGPKLAVSVAPLANVRAEALAPPPGIGQSSRIRVGQSRAVAAASTTTQSATVPDRLPEQVSQGSPQAGAIYLRASEFGRMDYARRIAAQLTGLNPEVERVREGRSERFLVRAGPFASVAAADSALDQARRAGVIDSHLVVE